jgi:hypothetical protein
MLSTPKVELGVRAAHRVLLTFGARRHRAFSAAVVVAARALMTA